MNLIKVNNSLDKTYDNLGKLYGKIASIEAIGLILNSAICYYIDSDSCKGDKLNSFNNVLCKVRDDLFDCKDNLQKSTDKIWYEYAKINKEIQKTSNIHN